MALHGQPPSGAGTRSTRSRTPSAASRTRGVSRSRSAAARRRRPARRAPRPRQATPAAYAGRAARWPGCAPASAPGARRAADSRSASSSAASSATTSMPPVSRAASGSDGSTATRTDGRRPSVQHRSRRVQAHQHVGRPDQGNPPRRRPAEHGGQRQRVRVRLPGERGGGVRCGPAAVRHRGDQVRHPRAVGHAPGGDPARAVGDHELGHEAARRLVPERGGERCVYGRQRVDRARCQPSSPGRSRCTTLAATLSAAPHAGQSREAATQVAATA